MKIIIFNFYNILDEMVQGIKFWLKKLNSNYIRFSRKSNLVPSVLGAWQINNPKNNERFPYYVSRNIKKYRISYIATFLCHSGWFMSRVSERLVKRMDKIMNELDNK